MIKNFVTRICPLCSKKLKVGDEDSRLDFFCEDFYLRAADNNDWLMMEHDDYVGGKLKESHYSVRIANGVQTQSTIVPPYWIISSTDSATTKIYKFDKTIGPPHPTNLLMEVPIIVPSDYLPEAFAKKIKNLVIFT